MKVDYREIMLRLVCEIRDCLVQIDDEMALYSKAVSAVCNDANLSQAEKDVERVNLFEARKAKIKPLSDALSQKVAALKVNVEAYLSQGSYSDARLVKILDALDRFGADAPHEVQVQLVNDAITLPLYAKACQKRFAEAGFDFAAMDILHEHMATFDRVRDFRYDALLDYSYLALNSEQTREAYEQLHAINLLESDIKALKPEQSEAQKMADALDLKMRQFQDGLNEK